jgi:hypothetical protein
MAKKINPVEEQNAELMARLLELSKACPIDQTNPRVCPLFPVRKLRPARRAEWFDDLSPDDLDYLAAYHDVCFRIKSETGSHK